MGFEGDRESPGCSPSPVEIETNFRIGPDYGFLGHPRMSEGFSSPFTDQTYGKPEWTRTGSGWGPDGPTYNPVRNLYPGGPARARV